jgi:hypothetical protein
LPDDAGDDPHAARDPDRVGVGAQPVDDGRCHLVGGGRERGLGRPVVILVGTKPGRTTMTLTPAPARASPSPWQKVSRPALDAPCR